MTTLVGHKTLSKGANPKSRSWTFTYIQDALTMETCIEERERFLSHFEGADYAICGIERTKDGKLHLQCYVHWRAPRTWSWIKTWHSECHIEASKGSPQKNFEYCSKEGDFKEVGTRPVQGKRTDLLDFVSKMKEQGLNTAIESFPETFIKFHRGIRDFHEATTFPRLGHKAVTVHWCYGRTGTGKTWWSHRRLESYPASQRSTVTLTDSGFILGLSERASVVLIDEFRPNRNFTLLLSLLGGYSSRVNVKGGGILWDPDEIIITTPHGIERTYGGSGEEVGQLWRRVTHEWLFEERGRPARDTKPQELKEEELAVPNAEPILIEDSEDEPEWEEPTLPFFTSPC